jgi:hypothetical protein
MRRTLFIGVAALCIGLYGSAAHAEFVPTPDNCTADRMGFEAMLCIQKYPDLMKRRLAAPQPGLPPSPQSDCYFYGLSSGASMNQLQWECR